MDRYEAIERIKTRFDKWALDDEDMKAIQTLIPELAESRDERIRKEMIDYFYGCIQRNKKTGFRVEQIKSWIAYLEKQKEQKPVHTAKEMWKEMRLEVYAQASGNRHEPNYSDDSTKMFSLCDIDEIFEKIGNSTVGSQPAEWSEKHIADIFEKVGLAKIAREQGNDELTNALQDAMLELSKAENTEWSEEDKLAIDRACVALRAYSKGDPPRISAERVNWVCR